METILVVTRQFGTQRIGDVISTQTQIQETLTGGHPLDVVKVVAPTTPTAGKKEI